jgi:transcriptional regulator with XRE-family HTH domain
MLGDNLKKIRKARGYTLEQLAEKIESSSGTLSHIENGTRRPSLDMLDKIAAALDTTVLDLMAGDTTAEKLYFENIDKMVNPEKSTVVSEDLENMLYAERIKSSSYAKAAEEAYNIDPELFITMCRAKELPEQDRKMLRDLSARLLEAHHQNKGKK